MKKIVLILGFGLSLMFTSCEQEKQEDCQQQTYTTFVVYDGFERDTLTVLGRPYSASHHNDHFVVEWQGEIMYATNNVVRILSVSVNN